MSEIMLRNMASVFLTSGDEVLLLYRQGGRVVNGVYIASAGGHFEKDELNDPEACALREMKEELGLDKTHLKSLALRYITIRQVEGEIRQNYYFFAETERHVMESLSSCEGTLRIFHKDDIPSVEMAVSAKNALMHWFGEGRFTKCIYAGAYDGKKTDFTPMM